MTSIAHFDVIVLGGGQAGLTAAITAAENGATVCILEIAPRALRGGNTRHTRNLRPMHESGAFPMEGAYGFDEYLDDLLRVTGGDTDHALAELTIRESEHSIAWLQDHGVAFQPPLSGTLHLGRTNAFFLGGGKALVNSLYRFAANLGVHTIYEATDIALNISGDRFIDLTYQQVNNTHRISGHSLVAAAGGFEANLDWLEEAWGPAARNFLVRGTPYNKGNILRQLLDAEFKQVGDPGQCHAVAIDGRAPAYDGGIVSRVDSVPLGIVVNNEGKRFFDEGEDFWPKRYAIWGRLIAAQPDQIGYAITDAKADGLFMPTVLPPLKSTTIDDLARQIDIPADSLLKTIDEFNAATVSGSFDHQALDGCRTEGLPINKSHWARQIDTPPYSAYPLRPGITFTYLGVAVDDRARVQVERGNPSENIFAAGEMMAGNILGRGYLAGIGMTIGSVFGRIAGREAARHAS
tara:strand:- start:1486 stop:2877 length:1392 start_codon:yes stop_codon:yes gene_type:complete